MNQESIQPQPQLQASMKDVDVVVPTETEVPTLRSAKKEASIDAVRVSEVSKGGGEDNSDSEDQLCPALSLVWSIPSALREAAEMWAQEVREPSALDWLQRCYCDEVSGDKPSEIGKFPTWESAKARFEWLAWSQTTAMFLDNEADVPTDIDNLIAHFLRNMPSIFEGVHDPRAGGVNKPTVCVDEPDLKEQFDLGYNPFSLRRPPRTRANLDGPNARLANIADLQPFIGDNGGAVTKLFGVSAILENTRDGIRGSRLFVTEPKTLVLSEDIRCRHLLAMGTTGSGKTTRLLLPIIRNDISDLSKTVIVLDSKGGELLPTIYELAELYRPGGAKSVRVVDFLNPDRSECWNPLASLSSEFEFHDFAERICNAADTRPPNNDSEFWIKNSIELLTGILWSLHTGKEGECTLRRARDLTERSVRDLREYATRFPSIAGLHSFIDYMDQGSHNAYTILADLRSRLALWRDDRVAQVTSHSEVGFKEVIAQPSIVVLRVEEDAARKLRPLTNAFFSELVSQIFQVASKSPGGCLANPVSIIIEELASAVGRIPDLDRFLNTVRARRVAVTASIQSVSQVQKEYGAESGPLLSGFCTKVFFPNLAIQDAEYASSLFGSASVQYREKTFFNDGKMPGVGHAATEEAVRVLRRPLLSAHEIRLPLEHAELGAAVTMELPDTPPFQAFLTPAYLLKQFAPVLDRASKRNKLGHLRDTPIPAFASPPPAENARIERAVANDSLPPGISDTRGWSDDQIKARLEGVKKQLDWDNTTGSARKWWSKFEDENKFRMALVLRLAEELLIRKATVTEFFLAYVYSNTDNIQANLFYLDYTRLKKEDEERKRLEEEASCDTKKESDEATVNVSEANEREVDVNDTSELTFIRCKSCRSLVPAVASSCRMCGSKLEREAASGNDTESPTQLESRASSPVATTEVVESLQPAAPQGYFARVRNWWRRKTSAWEVSVPEGTYEVNLKAGETFDGRYTIVQSATPTGRVWRARHVASQATEVALKFVPDAESLRREALALVSCRHRYIIRLDDFHSVGSLCYLSMEYAEGKDLQSYLKASGGKVEWKRARRWWKQLIEAVDFVHRAGILHRDICPEHVLLTDEESVRLASFRKALLPGEEQSDVPHDNKKRLHIPPEVSEGKPFAPSADIYAVASTIVMALTGKEIPAGQSVKDHLKRNSVVLPTKYERMLIESLNKDPKKRPQCAGDVLKRLTGKNSRGD